MERLEYQKQAYVWTSAVLLLPLLFWPLFFAGVTPERYSMLTENWLLSAMALLLSAVVTDSVLAAGSRAQAVVSASVWILLTSAALPILTHANWSGWMLAIVFVLHSLRSAWPLWRQREGWWHWYAWSRDSMAALVMFYWMMHWPV